MKHIRQGWKHNKKTLKQAYINEHIEAKARTLATIAISWLTLIALYALYTQNHIESLQLQTMLISNDINSNLWINILAH